jgi:hypothetical protein
VRALIERAKEFLSLHYGKWHRQSPLQMCGRRNASVDHSIVVCFDMLQIAKIAITSLVAVKRRQPRD